MKINDLNPEQAFVLGSLVGYAHKFAAQSKAGDYAALTKTSEAWSEQRRRARELGVSDDLVAEACRDTLARGLAI